MKQTKIPWYWVFNVEKLMKKEGTLHMSKFQIGVNYKF